MIFVRESKAEQTSKNATTGGQVYQFENDATIGYESNWILGHIENVTRVHCMLGCERKKRCKHVVFNEALQRCKLLKEAFSGGSRKLKDGEKIYSVEGDNNAGE